MSRRTVTSPDGTQLSAWTNDGSGVPIVVSNGLGTPIEAWPGITRETGRYRIVSWDHRGLGGSKRPSDETRINVSDHADDLIAVMDAYGMDRAIVIGWSLGVNVAFEVAYREPKRVAGVLAVAGVPGGSFSALFHPLPTAIRPRLGRISARALRFLGPVLNRIGDGLPASPKGAFDLRSLSTFGLDAVHAPTLLHVLRTFTKHDWGWYSKLANAGGDHAPIDLEFVDMPVTFVSGKWDSVTSAEKMRAASAEILGSRYVELAGTHFVPLQFPSAMNTELRALIARSEFGQLPALG